MADTKPTTPVATKTVKATPAKAKKSSNLISWIAPILCIILGYVIWRYVLGNPNNFTDPDPNGGFWPSHHGPKDALTRMYEGGIVVPFLLAGLFICLTFMIERALTISKAVGKGNINEFIRNVQFALANRDVDKAIALCDKQKGSVGNVMKQGLLKYKEMIHVPNTELDTDQKLLVIQKEIEEATALEMPMLERNLVFLSTLSSVSTLVGLLGTVIGMIRAFSALGADGGGGNATAQLSVAISEALYCTALGIGTSALAIISYNIFTTRIDGITYGIDESGFTLQQSFQANYK